ncbi:GntR family transcriptional regulator [Thermatribacter velox]|uniref:GntR family transcriptional regulator n=1 Tax=Thermatribacter velox TaxID=3039681 RepID=A0ABZ2YCT4_9BACT
MSNFHLIRKQSSSAREAAYKSLKTNIILLHLKPGQVITEQQIAETLSVSRTPVREAFIKLAHEGLLETYPQKGTMVSLIDMERVEEARFMRRILEKEILRLACQQFPEELVFELRSNLALQEICLEEKNFLRLFELDEDFHRIIYRGCNKERIWDLVSQISADFKRIRVLKLSSSINVKEVVKQHQEILSTILKQETSRIDNLVEEHLHTRDSKLKSLYKLYPEYFKTGGDKESKSFF